MRITCDNPHHDAGEGVCVFCVNDRIRKSQPTCGDCKAPISEPWHYRCWWCKVAFCRDCAAGHFGGPGDKHSASQAERIKVEVEKERQRCIEAFVVAYNSQAQKPHPSDVTALVEIALEELQKDEPRKSD